MADFHSWSKDSLVKLAEEQTARIIQLEDDIKMVQLAWREALAKAEASATLNRPQQGADHA